MQVMSGPANEDSASKGVLAHEPLQPFGTPTPQERITLSDDLLLSLARSLKLRRISPAVNSRAGFD
jgi:hypothetical protein